MADRRSRQDAGSSLFESHVPDADDRDDASEDGGGLDRLVTRVSARPKGWAMKWRPDESKSLVEAEADRHPARSPGQSPESVTVPAVPESSEPESNESEPAIEREERSQAVVETDAPEVITSRTWAAESDAAHRHPRTPGLAATAPTPAPAVMTRPTRIDPLPRRSSRLMQAGWPLAAILALAWGTTAWVGGPKTSETGTSSSEPAIESTPFERVLARPEPEALFDSDLAREEIASLRNERARLMQEVDAAFILLQDHRRLSRELQESMANNQGASIEVDALAEDARRWERRHEVAVTRLDQMEAELQEADRREADLEQQIEYLRGKLKAVDGSGGTD